MTTSTEMVLIGGVIDALVRHGSRCGETHIQKTIYLAKHVEGVPFDSDFVLYKHGPYSFDLTKSLNHMRSRGIIAVASRDQFGLSYSVNKPLWAALNRAAGGVFDGYSEGIDRICSELAQKNVAELERVTTAVYVSKSFPALGSMQRVEKLVELKPHISLELAVIAFEQAQRFAERET